MVCGQRGWVHGASPACFPQDRKAESTPAPLGDEGWARAWLGTRLILPPSPYAMAQSALWPALHVHRYIAIGAYDAQEDGTDTLAGFVIAEACRIGQTKVRSLLPPAGPAAAAATPARRLPPRATL